MTREEIIKLAREAGFIAASAGWADNEWFDRIERFAALVAAHEREACAEVCMAVSSDITLLGTAAECVNAIRKALAERFCDKNCTWLDHHPECDKAEQPVQQEPVAVYVGETWCGSVVRLYGDLPLETPLYTSPQASKPFVGLTDEEIDAMYEAHHNQYGQRETSGFEYERAIEANLREKNG